MKARERRLLQHPSSSSSSSSSRLPALALPTNNNSFSLLLLLLPRKFNSEIPQYSFYIYSHVFIQKMRSVVDIERPTLSTTHNSLSTSPSFASSSSSLPVYMNYALISALLAFALAQSIKVFTTWYREHRWDLKQLVGSGGMPSSHSATVTALAVAVGLQDGLGGSTFATALILACIVMYDATGVRLHAGRQAEVLNQIVYELPAEHPLAESMPLRELLGHTPPQVIVGGLLGMMTATMLHLILHSGSHA